MRGRTRERHVNTASKLTSFLICAALGLSSASARAAERSLRVDFSIDLYSARLLDYSLPTGFEYVGPAAAPDWAKTGYFVVKFDDAPYANPFDTANPTPRSRAVFGAEATSAELFLSGMQGMSPDTTVGTGAAIWARMSSGVGGKYYFGPGFNTTWTDAQGVARQDTLSFDLDGYNFNRTIFNSDFELARFAAQSIDSSNDHLLVTLDTYLPGKLLRSEYNYSFTLISISEVPEPAPVLTAVCGLLVLSGVSRRSRLRRRQPGGL